MWGCRILVTDFYERETGEYRKGSLNMENVAVHNCSQADTDTPAIHFDTATAGFNSLKNNAFHSGKGRGIVIDFSKNVDLQDNVIHDFLHYGMRVENSYNIKVEGNFISSIKPERYPKFNEWKVPVAAYLFANNKATTVQGNTASSSWGAGFIYDARDCDDSTPEFVFQHNIAHSISGFGAVPQKPNKSRVGCTEVSNFSGFKNSMGTVHHAAQTGELRCKNITSVDSGIGISCIGAANEKVEISDSQIFGNYDLQMLDCPREAEP
jgi:hypothetical protein